MQLTCAQLGEMNERGFLLFPSLFDAEELALIRAASLRMITRQGPEVVAEDDDPATAKMIFGAHEADEVFARVARHPRLVGPVEQLAGERVHLFQSRINVKRPFRASGWTWHQDFNQWNRMDGMLTPRALIAGVFVDDVNPCNGPLLVIPGSHRRGHIVNETSMEIADAVVEAAANEAGIEPLMGAPGTVILFHCLLIHGSAPNITPWTRTIFYLNFTPVSQHELQPLREWFHCDPNVRPVVPLPDDCLLQRRATA
jgi:ectoine hydroxylase